MRYICTDSVATLHRRLGLLEPGKEYEYEDAADREAAEGTASLTRVDDEPTEYLAWAEPAAETDLTLAPEDEAEPTTPEPHVHEAPKEPERELRA